MKSVMSPQEHFARIASPRIQRSTFDRSHGYKTTFDAGVLIPIFIDEALPGDTFNLSATIFGRLNTPLKPIMDNIFIDCHWFSVPERLVWANWQRFNGEQDNPTDSTDFIMPTITSPVGGYLENSLYDYLGLPTKVAGMEHRADFLRAIHLIWNQWYRDENLQDSLEVPLDDGPDDPAIYNALPLRNKRKDYFTSCLPFAQKAQPVTIPLGTTAPVYGTGKSLGLWDGSTNYGLYSNNPNLTADVNAYNNTLPQDGAGGGSPTTQSLGVVMSPGVSGLAADLSAASAVTINALREASQIQVMYELDARGGTRYIELLRVHFGVTSPDARLQRPEFLGGFTTPLHVSPIAQTAPTVEDQTPQGNLAAMGTFSKTQKGFVKSFVEHEIVVGFISARADLNYQQGLNRMWSRSTRFDFYWPSFANLGEQAVLNQELYATGTSSDTEVFGYQERYGEYRYKPSMVTSLFRSNATNSLDVWHLSQEFDSTPGLTSSFIVEQPPIDRIVAVPTEPNFMVDCYFDFKCARPMPTYATPGGLVNL